MEVIPNPLSTKALAMVLCLGFWKMQLRKKKRKIEQFLNVWGGRRGMFKEITSVLPVWREFKYCVKGAVSVWYVKWSNTKTVINWGWFGLKMCSRNCCVKGYSYSRRQGVATASNSLKQNFFVPLLGDRLPVEVKVLQDSISIEKINDRKLCWKKNMILIPLCFWEPICGTTCVEAKWQHGQDQGSSPLPLLREDVSEEDKWGFPFVVVP